jgi:hypothetical protein
MSQSVLILGSQGVLGSLVADAFRQDGWTVTGTSRRAHVAPDARHVDLASPDTLEDVLDDVKPDLVVSSVPDATLAAERAVLRRGGLILNTSTLAAADIRRLREAPVPAPASGVPANGEMANGDLVTRPHGTVVVYAGIAPGLTNLVAASLLARHPDADEIEVALTSSVKGSFGPSGADGAHDGLTAAARHRTAVIPLPKPFGRSRCLGMDEFSGWFGSVAEGRTVSPYACVIPRAARYALLAANAAGLLSRLPRKAIAANPPSSPAAASAEPVAHWIAVRRNGTRLAARTIRAEGDYRSSAGITVLFAQALTRHASPPRAGVLFPEEAVTLEDLRPGLAAAGITISDEKVS